MKKRIISFYVLLGCFSTMLQAQSVVIGHINTEIVTPLTITEQEQMSFGKFSSLDTGGTIQISINDVRTSTGGIQLLDAAVGSSAKFVLLGVPGALVSVVLPQTPVHLYNEGSYSMLVDAFNSNLPVGGKATDSSTGRLEIRIGASLNVGNLALNPPGLYTGLYDIVFTYN